LLKKLSVFLGKYKKLLVWIPFLMAVDVICELLIPFLMSKIVDIGIPGQDIRYILRIGILMVGLACVAILLGCINMKLSAVASQGFAANLRRSLFEKIQDFSFSNIDKFSTASLVTRLTNDVNQLQFTALMGMRIFIRAPLMLVCSLVLAISINARLSIILIVAIPILGLAVWLIMRKAEKLFSFMQTRLDALNSSVQGNLVAIRVVKAFVRQVYEKTKFKKSNDELMQAAIHAANTVIFIMPIMLLIINFATISIIWVGGKMVGAGSMGTGELISFLSYIMLILINLMMVSFVFLLAARAKACGQRVLEVLETKNDIYDLTANQETAKQGKIEFCHVDFKYAAGTGDYVLKDISFTANPGEMIALVGGTGTGKTTLVNLIPRLYEATNGQVKIDDRDVRDYTLEALRHSIGMVLQKNVLFSGTIRENLLWGNENATQKQIEKATKVAQAHEFILSFPKGYDTQLEQGGVNLSGGQRQRLCIARALLKEPSILILDDSTSAVDTATELLIRRAFREYFPDTTIIIIAQRISSVREADKILVLDSGQLVGCGTHQQLLENNEVYREINSSQQEGVVA